MKYLHIEYANPLDLTDSISVPFRLTDFPVTKRWAKLVKQAQAKYTIDDPARFYGFGSYEEQVADALERINRCITLIKIRYPKVAVGYLTDVHNQDRLNYWHHVFEVYHGLLDKQSGDEIEPVLAELNLCVHRCESIARGAKPRHVVTYYGLPKTELLDLADYEDFTDQYQLGTVYLNYAEIGKTLEDLAQDNDRYISDNAFRPFKHLSADFNVKFYDVTQEQSIENHKRNLDYYFEHEDFFINQGLYMNHPYLRAGSVPLAHIEYSGNIMQDLSTRLYVKSVSFT